jgi:TPR repeat protein
MRRWFGLAALAVLITMGGPGPAQSLDAAREALASGRSDEAARLAEPLAAAGHAEALALLGLIARDAIPPDTDIALTLLETAAASGAPTALVALGRAYQSGELGLRADAARALDHYERAIAARSEVAEVNLIGLVASGALGAPHWPALQDRLQVLAGAGTHGAAAMLAEMLATGRAGDVQPERARALVEAAAEAGDARAMRLMGWLLMQGVGGPADAGAGRALLERAARAGDAAAATDLGLLHRDGGAGLAPEISSARGWFERAALAGDGWGATHLARLLSDGDPAVPDDPARALDLYRAGDARGVPAATHGLAIALWDGLGTGSDPVAARSVMTRAAAAGFARAINDLGVMLETGVASDPDPTRAAELYEAAALAGDTLGAWNLADLLLNPALDPTKPAEGYAWCLWAEDNAPDADTRATYREGCAGAAARLSADDRARGAARFAELPRLTPLSVAAP